MGYVERHLKKIRQFFFIQVLLCLLASTVLADSAQKTPLLDNVWKITSLDWQPYSDAAMVSQGNSIQKLRSLLKQKGIELVVEFYPWARAREIAKRKGYVGYYPAWPEEVAEGFTASLPVDWSEIGVLTHVHSGVKWTGLEALFTYKVGLVSTYSYPEAITRLAQANPLNVDPTPNEISLLRKLSARRIKVAITDPLVMDTLAEREGIENIKLLKLLSKAPLVLAFNNQPENLKRLELLNSLLQRQP